MSKRKTVKRVQRTAPMIQVGGVDSADRAALVRVLAANLPKAIASGQREIVDSLIRGISGTFPSHTTITNSTFSTRGDD